MASRNPASIGLHLAVTAFTALAWIGMPCAAGVEGTVLNATTGGPAAGVTLTLSSFEDGMTLLEETVSGTDGAFSFEKELPAVTEGQQMLGSIRAEHDGINYTKILPAGAATRDVLVTVYSASSEAIPPPDVRAVVLEPGETEMIVQDIFLFVNDSSPPVTYSSEAGTLRFVLPEAARGVVRVSGTGPAGMPLTSTALPSETTGVYKVDFPLKPGENRIALSYLLPHENGAEFSVRSMYPALETRVAVPDGVSLEGAGIAPVGREPTTNFELYDVPDGGPVAIAVTRRPSGSSQISIEPAPIANELGWIAGLAVLILGLGFAHLLASATPRSGKAGSGPEG